MSKTFYADFATHMAKSYFSKKNPCFKLMPDAEQANWMACHNAVQNNFSPGDVAFLEKCYLQRQNFDNAVAQEAKNSGIALAAAWRMIRRFEKRIVELRGLI